ncbi:MAG: hypothetical protein Q9201_001839 [Fulgogasparrea decipioides]
MSSPDLSFFGSSSSTAADHFFGAPYPADTDNDFDAFETEHPFPNATPFSHPGFHTALGPADAGIKPSHSTETSPASSSNSSTQHHRHASSNSSRSATFETGPIDSDEARMHNLKIEGSQETGFTAASLDSMTREQDLDRQMGELFDFDSAANSPGKSVPTETSSNKPIVGVAVPHLEPSPHQAQLQISQPQKHERSEAPRSIVSNPSKFNPQNFRLYPAAHTPPYDFYGNHPSFPKIPSYNPLYGTSACPPLVANAGFVGPDNVYYSQPTFVRPTATFNGSGHYEQQIRPNLTIHPIADKTRVETQVPVTMTLYPIPPGITKLHLPMRTLAMSKWMAKPPPSKSPDMLELDVMPVCASAMKKRDRQLQAFALARGEGFSPQAQNQMQRLSSEGRDNVRDSLERLDPMDGGPISVCDSCMNRERKRVNRKIEKKEPSEEEIRWKQSEKERIVVFNDSEIQDWKPYGSSNFNDKKIKGGRRGKMKGDAGEEISTPTSAPELNVPNPEDAKQIRLSMRITCYCRHQGESEGFQVILTLKDHQGKCIAQAISSSVLITDDHKAPGPQVEGRNKASSDERRLQGENIFPPAPSSNAATVPPLFNLGQSRSTENFSSFHPYHHTPSLHRSATSLQLQHRQSQPLRSTALPTPSYNPPYHTSTTLTPRHLSRQASPSAISGPAPKRRKASGPGMDHRPLVDLSMTRMEIANAAPQPGHSASASPGSSSGASEGLAMGRSRSCRYPRTVGLTVDAAPMAMSAIPPTEHNAVGESACIPPPERSLEPSPHSSDEDHMPECQAHHQIGAQSTQPTQPQPDHDMAAHANALHHSLLHLPGAVVHQAVAPTMLDVVPSEGSKAGGTKVIILGDGFHDGLDVLFADAVACRTIVLNSTTIKCITPPSFQAGRVQITLRGYHQPSPQIWFRYIDTDEEDSMRLILAILHHRNSGELAIASDIAQSVIGGQHSQSNRQSSYGTQHQQIPGSGAMNLELAILGVLDIIDQADSSIAPLYNLRQPNGQTMVHLAASLGYHRLVAGLLARGANPDLRDRNGMSAMHMACLRGQTKVIRKLLSAGGDPTLRSLLGLAPIDMAMTQEVHELMSTIERHTRSRSLGATPMSHLSRASSLTSVQSSRRSLFGDDTMIEAYRSRPATPAQVWTRSRRNSASAQRSRFPCQNASEPAANTHLVTAAAAMAVWRDNLAGQIQHFQQSVQRTLPNLQIPNLPPLPNFEAYQEHPMVRRISSLVPRMNGPPAPPSYEEIYPDSSRKEDVKKASAARAIGDTFMDEKCAINFDQSEAYSLSVSTKEQGDGLQLAHRGKVKTLANDRKLFFVWVSHIFGPQSSPASFVVHVANTERTPGLLAFAGWAMS